MGARGYRSAASLAVVGPSGIETIERPRPPAELSDEQAAEWIEIVNRMPADWFPKETHGLLVCYCRHVIRGRRLAQMIEGLEQRDDLDLREYRLVLTAEAENSRTIATLSTKMRLAHQATVDKRKPSPRMIDKPW